jgi:imidazolonepropionase-like amidohydrolase
MISQTAGHGDFRLRSETPRGPLSTLGGAEIAGISSIADGVPEVLRRTREQLLLGASQVKIMVGGGVSSQYDPIDVQQFTAAEIRAAVDAARDWGTYVAAHVYTSEGILRAIECGVMSIEHGQLADARTAAAMAEAGAWWSLQPFLADEDANPQASPEARAAQREIAEGTVRAVELARSHGVKIALGTDILFSPARTWTQGRQLAKFARFMPPAEVLACVTSGNAELLALSGQRSPYPGPLGVIEAGAQADLLVLDADPLVDIEIIGDPERMKLIMKAGAIVKDTLGLASVS